MNNIFNYKSLLGDVLTILEKFKNKVVFLVDDDNILTGSLTDGDIRRFIINKGEIKPNTPLKELMNEHVFFLTEQNIHKQPVTGLLEKYKEIPVVDSSKKIIRILSENRTFFFIGSTLEYRPRGSLYNC